MKYKRYQDFKDSGVEWFEEIPLGWNTKRLKLVAILTMGQSPPSESCNDLGEGLPFLQGNAEFGAEHPTSRLFCSNPPKCGHAGSHLISVRAPVGAINTADQEYGIGRGLCAVQPLSQHLDSRFTHYMLSELKGQLDAVATGSTYDAVKSAQVGNVICVLPEIDEQRTIAIFLDRETAKIDALVAKKERLIELLQEKRSALITHAVTKGLDPNVPMKDSGLEWLGEIPEHWEVKRLKHIAQLRSGEPITSSEIEETGEYPVYGGNGLRGYTSRFTHEGEFPLIGRQGALCGCVNYAQGRFWASEHAVVAKPFEGQLPMWLADLLLVMRLNQYSESAAQPGLAVETITDLYAPVPPPNEQGEIVGLLQSEKMKTEALIAKIKRAIAFLKEYRSALISAAVTGKIDVREKME